MIRTWPALAVLAVAAKSTTARLSARMPPETIVLALVLTVSPHSGLLGVVASRLASR